MHQFYWRVKTLVVAPVESMPHGPLKILVSARLLPPVGADIFYNNCFKNGLLPVILSEQQVDLLFEELKLMRVTN